MATENPRRRQIKNRSAGNHGSEDQQLHGKVRMNGELRVPRPEPASHPHNPRAQRNLAEGSEYLDGAQRSVAQPENEEQREEIEVAGKSGGQCRSAVLQPLEKEVQE